MFEFDQSGPAHAALVRPEGTYQPRDGVDQISFLLWGEHCVECAAPACFETCDLYEPRPDLRCRRFKHGTQQNPHFATVRGHAAEVAFKKWAKLEAIGNTTMAPVADVLASERRVAFFRPILNFAGRVAHFFLRKIGFRYVTQAWLQRRARKLHRREKQTKPDAFLLEVYNPESEPVSLQFLISVARQQAGLEVGQGPKPFVTTLEFPPGYQSAEIDASQFEHVTDSGHPFDMALIPTADSNARLVFLTADFVTWKKDAAGKDGKKKVPDIKCVVFDLDNTLWEGILVENPDVQLRPGVRETLETLDKRGVLLSIASKNDLEPAWKRLEELGVAEYFLHPQISWMPKSGGVKTICERLNIGIDTFAFVDDNPFELEEVGNVLPMVETVHVDELDGLVDRPRFQGSSSVEAKNRRQMYRDAIVREEQQQDFGDDYIGFLDSCDIRLEIGPIQKTDFDRVAELVQRTNQLNFSGRKYTREQLDAFVADPGMHKYVLTCQDKFGSYGTVGFCLVRRDDDAIAIDDFMLSCRVQGKFIEQALFNWLMTTENPNGATLIRVNYKKTDRNTPAGNVLKKLGFTPADEGGLELDIGENPLTCTFIEVRPREPVSNT